MMVFPPTRTETEVAEEELAEKAAATHALLVRAPKTASLEDFLKQPRPGHFYPVADRSLTPKWLPQHREEAFFFEADTDRFALVVYPPRVLMTKSVPENRYGHYGVWMGSWEELCEVLCEVHVVENKADAEAWSPGIIGGKNSRGKANVAYMSRALFLDIDGSQEELEATIRRVNALGLECVWYTTASHLWDKKLKTPSTEPRFRLVIPMTRSVPVAEWPQFIRAAMVYITGVDEGVIAADKQCVDAARVYYMASQLAANPDTAFTSRTKGRYLDPSEVPCFEVLSTFAGTPAVVPTVPPLLAPGSSCPAVFSPAKRALTAADIKKMLRRKIPKEIKVMLRRASKGDRMVLADGYKPSKADAKLPSGAVDADLSRLMWHLALAFPNLDPRSIQDSFAASIALLQSDDAALKNTAYKDDVMAKKYVVATKKLAKQREDKARRIGLDSLADAIEQAQRYEGVAQGTQGYCLVLRDNEGNVSTSPITDFWFEVVEQRNNLEGPDSWIVNIHLEDGRVLQRREIGTDVFAGKNAFQKQFVSQSAELSSSISVDAHVSGIKKMLMHQVRDGDLPKVETTAQIGWDIERDALVRPGGTHRVSDYSERSDLVLSQGHGTTNRSLTAKMMKPVFADRGFMAKLLELLPRLNSPAVIWVILGWLMIALARPRVKPLLSGFIHLVLVGRKNSGKTALLRFLIRVFGGYEGTIDSINNGYPTLMNSCKGVASVPLWFDEHKPHKMKLAHREAVPQFLRETFDDAERAPLHNGAPRVTKVCAPIVVSGEAPPEGDDATLQRCCIVETPASTTDPSDPATAPFREAFRELATIPNLEDASLSIQLYAARIAWEPLLNEARDEVDALPGIAVASERTRNMLCAIRAGENAYRMMATSYGVALPPRISCAELCAGPLEHHTGDSTDHDAFLKFLGDLSLALEENAGRLGAIDVVDYEKVDHEKGEYRIRVEPAFKVLNAHFGGRYAGLADKRQLFRLATDAHFTVKDSKGHSRFEWRTNGGRTSGIKIREDEMEKLPIETRGFLQANTNRKSEVGVFK